MRNLFFRILMICFCVLSLIVNTQAFFEIVEVFPNTIDDKNLEYIILKNISEESKSLSGYSIADKKKEYKIIEDVFLESGERRKFLRTETKIALNNTNEIVQVISPDDEVIDEIEYKSSIKGVFLTFGEDEEIKEQEEKLIISDEVSLGIISDEVGISELEDKKEETREEAEEVEAEVIKEEVKIPEIIFSLQRPSYIEYLETEKAYLCDESRDECKVNFDLRESFGQDFSEKDYTCKIDFGFVGFESQAGRCNPNTVTFPEGEFTVTFSIFDKSNMNNFSEKSIHVLNMKGDSTLQIGVDVEKEISETSENKKVTSEDKKEVSQDREVLEKVLVQEDVLFVPDIVLGLQRPSYIEYSETEKVYLCDENRDECKVNFDLRDSFGEGFPEGDYICKIDFGLGELTGQESRCNPSTVIFPKGTMQVKFQIFHEDNNTIFSQRIITIQNIVQDNVSQNTGIISSYTAESSKSSEDNIAKIHISMPRIIVQSGLEGTSRYYQCLKEKCRVNLNYEKRHKDERCYWDFNGGITTSTSTHTRCNPGYVTYPKGTFDLSLKVYEKDNKQNKKTYRFYVYNEGKNQNGVENTVDNKISLDGETQENKEGRKSEDEIFGGEIEGRIILQGKMGKEKILREENILECGGVEKCYVNFDSKIMGSSKNLKYSWKVNGNIFSEKKNPKGIWLEIGENILELEITQDDEVIFKNYFYVGVSNDKNNENDILEKNATSENTFNDSEENEKLSKEKGGKKFSKSALKKIFTQNFLVLKYDGLRISGKAPIGSKVEIYLDGEKTLEGNGDKKGKYKILTKNLNAGTYIFDTKITFASGEELFIEKSGEFEILESKIQNWISEKDAEAKKKKKALKKIFTQNFLVLKYDGLRISGKAPINSKVEIFLNGKIILSGVGNEKGKYRLVTKNLKAGKYIFDTKIIYTNGEVLYVENSGEFEVLASKIGNWFVTKKKKKSSSKNQSRFTFPKLILEANAYSDFDSNTPEELSIFRKIIFVAGLSFLMLLVFITIVLKNIAGGKVFILESEKLKFGVRQKLCLLV